MRIVHVAAGAGGMYCGACARDAALVRGLISRGHDVTVVPLYTPLRTDGSPLDTAPIHLGGINAYLQQKSALFRHTPRFLDRLFDSPSLLGLATRFAVSVRPQQLGPMTVSVLRGAGGLQAKEHRRLLNFVASERPDLVSITNSLLLAIAPAASAPVVCAVQGEDSFVEAIPEPHRSAAQRLMREHARAVELFLSPSEAYASQMATFLDVPRSRFEVVRVGVDAASFPRSAPPPDSPFVVGYLSAITPCKGLDILADALALVASGAHPLTPSREGRGQRRTPEVLLRIAGRVMDRGYWRHVSRKLDEGGVAWEYAGEVDFAGKVEFLRRCHAFVLPSRVVESRGVAVMEAMAAGAPVVVPETGVFPEMLALTGGGVLVPPDEARAVADAIAGLAEDPAEAAEMGRRGAEGIAEHYSAEQMVEQTLAASNRLVSPPVGSR